MQHSSLYRCLRIVLHYTEGLKPVEDHICASFMAHQRLRWGILSQLKGQQMTQVIAVFHSAVMCP